MLLAACAASMLGVAGLSHARGLAVDDLVQIRNISDLQLSPDGRWMAYTVEQADVQADESRTQLWKVGWDGKERLELTHGPASVSQPRWKPDGTALAFLAERPDGHEKKPGTQVWVLDARGGEARPLTDLRGEISSFEWSPNGRRLALVMREAAEDSAPGAQSGQGVEEKPKPLVIDRYQFKNDHEGYLHADSKPNRIFLYDLASKALTALTNDARFEEGSPAWSPDGTRIAFVSNRDEQPDRSINDDIWVAEAKAGATPQRLTTSAGSDTGPVWKPDGTEIAYLEGPEPKFSYYGPNRLAVVAGQGGTPRYPAGPLDRDVSRAEFSSDGKFIDFIVDDDRQAYLARVASKGGPVARSLDGSRSVRAISRARTATGGNRAANGRTALLVTDPTHPPEAYAWENGKLRPLTAHNQEWLSSVQFGRTQPLEFPARDGVKVSALLTTPAGHEQGQRRPLLLWIHGGPYGQDDYGFDFERQLFAAQGYAVLQVNYRGSSGRGSDFGHGIFADWGNKDLTDLLDGVGHAISLGVADARRMMVGGWSNGGIMTNYVIARDPRFKAAASGAGYGNLISFYGFDQYTFVYDHELRPPWVDPQLWMRLSYPLFEADKIRTPTLFVGGQLDFNVPLIGGEQMYQALKSLNVPTQLVIYPGEHHGISRPSFQRDLLQRYLAWFAKYL